MIVACWVADVGFIVVGKRQEDVDSKFNMSNMYKQSHMTLFIVPTLDCILISLIIKGILAKQR